jgi:hypothetical protein
MNNYLRIGDSAHMSELRERVRESAFRVPVIQRAIPTEAELRAIEAMLSRLATPKDKVNWKQEGF